jgi:hypothetical protein
MQEHVVAPLLRKTELGWPPGWSNEPHYNVMFRSAKDEPIDFRSRAMGPSQQ